MHACDIYIYLIYIYYLQGMGLLRLMTTLITLPSVSMPSERGVTSTNTSAEVAELFDDPANIAPCTLVA
jgi:hypothetical protein